MFKFLNSNTVKKAKFSFNILSNVSEMIQIIPYISFIPVRYIIPQTLEILFWFPHIEIFYSQLLFLSLKDMDSCYQSREETEVTEVTENQKGFT